MCECSEEKEGNRIPRSKDMMFINPSTGVFPVVMRRISRIAKHIKNFVLNNRDRGGG